LLYNCIGHFSHSQYSALFSTWVILLALIGSAVEPSGLITLKNDVLGTIELMIQEHLFKSKESDPDDGIRDAVKLLHRIPYS